ncbi:polyamine ABC transporter permease, partial [Pseudomonas amygdali pv. mori str. 301020]
FRQSGHRPLKRMRVQVRHARQQRATDDFGTLPIRIAAMVAGDITLHPNMASALAMILVGLMTLVTVVHQWLLKRSYHVAR